MSSTSTESTPRFYRRTKIVATLGPASNNETVIGDLIEAGVNVFRLNFSHGSHEDHAAAIEKIREQAAAREVHIGILGDLQGPKIRLGDIEGNAILLEEEQPITLTTEKASANTKEGRVHVTYDPLPSSVTASDILLLDDGRIRLQVIEVSGKDVSCKVVQGGELSSRKGINRLGGGLSADAITEKRPG